MKAYIFESDYDDELDVLDSKIKDIKIEEDAEEKACEMCESFNGYYCVEIGEYSKGLVGCIESKQGRF